MINSRNGFSYTANIFVLSLAFVLFSQIDNSVTQFRILAETCIFSGLFASTIFLTVIKENKLTELALQREAKY